MVNGIGPVANYFYDARNMRVLKDVDTDADGVPDTQTSYYYDDMIVVEERDESNSGALLKSYIHGKQYMHELLMLSSSATALGHFYLHSHLCNVHALVDTTGTVVERYKYEAYGKRSVFDPAFVPRAASLYAQRFGRTGHYLDPETAMYYYGYRYYAPELGRWISRDPIEEEGGLNLQAFVDNAPTHFIDPMGLKKLPCCCCCVEDLRIDGLKKIVEKWKMGHEFDIIASLKYIENQIKTDCRYEWWEKTDKPAYWWVPPGEWMDFHKSKPDWFPGWAARKRPCPGAEPMKDNDKPSLSFLSWETNSRKLLFDIRVRSGEGCPCAKKSITIRAEQYLNVKVGHAQWQDSYFKIISTTVD